MGRYESVNYDSPLYFAVLSVLIKATWFFSTHFQRGLGYSLVFTTTALKFFTTTTDARGI